MPLTLAHYAEAKGLDIAQLKALGLSDHSDARGAYVRIPYFSETGKEIAVRQRFELDGPNRFRWRTGAKPFLYGLDRLAEARAKGFVVLVEGESDCHTLWQAGVPALGLPGAGLWRETRDAAHFEGIATIYVAHEGDRGAQTIIEWLAKSSIRHRAQLVAFDQGAKDASALYLADRSGFADAFAAKLKEARPWSEIEATRVSADEARAYETARALAHDGDILGRLCENLSEVGLVGEDRNACVLYLALTSRLLKKPVSIAYKGPSSGGKSFAVERVLAHFPGDAVVAITSMSEKALIFMDDELSHKHLVLAEADGAAGEFQDYLVRTLLSEGRLEHRMAEKSEHGIVGRHIVKEGPTGLVLTTTKVKLHPENETRLISLTANDTPEQTRAILAAIALRDETAEIHAQWPALQAWLAHGERRVVIPYGGALARLVSDGAVRMRRDFGAVLSLIEAHALLHRATRGRDVEGQIVATLADYAAVRALVFDLIAEGVAATVPAHVREAIEAVRDLGGDRANPVPLAQITARLKIDKSSAARRCVAAKLGGYLVNEQTIRGREALYRLGEKLPADEPVLPPLDALTLAHQGVGRGVLYPPEMSRNTTHGSNGVARHLEGIDHPPPRLRCEASEGSHAVVPSAKAGTVSAATAWQAPPYPDFEERAAILEYDQGLSREEAEAAAVASLEEARRKRRA